MHTSIHISLFPASSSCSFSDVTTHNGYNHPQESSSFIFFFPYPMISSKKQQNVKLSLKGAFCPFCSFFSFLFMDTVQSYEAWLFLRFPGNPALNPELQDKIKDIDLLKWSALSDTQFYEKNLSTLPFFTCFAALKPMPGDCHSFCDSFFFLPPTVFFAVF